MLRQARPKVKNSQVRTCRRLSNFREARKQLLGREQLLDLRDRMRGQCLGDLRFHAIGDLGVKGLAKIAQYFRRCDDDKLLEAIGAGVTVQHLRQLIGEPFLGNVMPIGFFHGTPGSAVAREGASGTIGALFARRRIVLLKNPLDDEIDALRMAPVA